MYLRLSLLSVVCMCVYYLKMPKSGTTLPSPDICYISRHWLHLLRHCAYPGPIFQYDFACRHGCVLPTLSVDEGRSLALCVRREVWDKYQQLYRGGPLVQQLEVCIECQVSPSISNG